MNSWSQKSRTLDPKTQELLIPNLESNELLSHILQIVGGSYFFIPESAMDSPPYMLLGTQALDGIGMQLLWVSDIAILYLFCYLFDNLINNVRDTLWVFQWPCEYLKLTASEEFIRKRVSVRHCVANATTHRLVETIYIGQPWYHYINCQFCVITHSIITTSSVFYYKKQINHRCRSCNTWPALPQLPSLLRPSPSCRQSSGWLDKRWERKLCINHQPFFPRKLVCEEKKFRRPIVLPTQCMLPVLLQAGSLLSGPLHNMFGMRGMFLLVSSVLMATALGYLLLYYAVLKRLVWTDSFNMIELFVGS